MPLLLLLLTGLLGDPAVAQDTRGMGLGNAPTETTAPTGRSYALVIGINDYDDENYFSRKSCPRFGSKQCCQSLSRMFTQLRRLGS